MRSSTSVLIAFVSGLLRSTARQPCLRGEQRVCKHQAASQEPKKQHRLRVLSSRETVSVFLGGSRLMRAEGSALSLQREDASRRSAARSRSRGVRALQRIAQAGSRLESREISLTGKRGRPRRRAPVAHRVFSL